MRKKILGASWKMHKNTKAEVKSFVLSIKGSVSQFKDLEMFLIPSFPLIDYLKQQIQSTHIGVGAQNVAFVEHGPYTGEVSIETLIDVGCDYVEIGHAERREHFNETNEAIAKKVKLTLDHHCVPLVCVGETLKQKEEGYAFEVLKEQVQTALKYVAVNDISRVIFAYEPVWAIGQQEGASSDYVATQHQFIRSIIASIDAKAAQAIRIIYGGSVKKESAAAMMENEDVDGLFAGRFALEPNNYIEIAQIVHKTIK